MSIVQTLLPLVGPDFGAVGAPASSSAIVGALLTYGLITAVLMLVVCAATWALASSSGSWHAASKAKTGVFVALGGAALTGACARLGELAPRRRRARSDAGTGTEASAWSHAATVRRKAAST